MERPQPNWDQRIESDLENINWIVQKNQDSILFHKSYNEIRQVLKKLVKDVQEIEKGNNGTDAARI